MPNDEQLTEKLAEISTLLAELRSNIDELASPDLAEDKRVSLLHRTDFISERLTAMVGLLELESTAVPIENLPPLEFDN